MEYDFAIIYFGLTRSIKYTHETHKKYIFDVLQKENLTYKTFMHTWKPKDDLQNIRGIVMPEKIDYSEYKLLSPDFYKLDDEVEFLDSINMDNYFYKDVWEKIGHSHRGEWLPKMVANHVCMLESQKRGLNMVKTSILNGNNYKFIMFIRPDITIENELNVGTIIPNNHFVHVPNHSHYEGVNDQFAIMNYENANIYGNRINELAEFRKNHGRIVGEKYCKHVLLKNNMKINMLDFKHSICRPAIFHGLI